MSEIKTAIALPTCSRLIVCDQTVPMRLFGLSLPCILFSGILQIVYAASVPAQQKLLKDFAVEHCLDCHDDSTASGGFSIESLLTQPIERHPENWETVVRRLATRQMPPAEVDKPGEGEYGDVLKLLTTRLDTHFDEHPITGKIAPLRRLTRTEYKNAIRDLLNLDIDVELLLPADESSRGFDNITVTGLSPALMSRYLVAAQKISRLAVGQLPPGGTTETFRMRPDVTQDLQRVKGLPIGTRGGMLIPYNFPRDGDYEIQVRLMRDRNDEVEGLRGRHKVEILVDRALQKSFPIARPSNGESHRDVDQNLKARVFVKAGRHEVGATFVKRRSSLLETDRQPLNVHYNFYRHPRLGPAVYQVTITGPIQSGSPGESPSRQKIFSRRPKGANDVVDSARKIVSRLLRQAYRRPINKDDLLVPMKFFQEEYRKSGFDSGIGKAISAILVNPNFLFRIEKEPLEIKADRPFKISDLELASRLSFFLWSSSPDEELLKLAENQQLGQPEILEQQVRRMLLDRKSKSLTSNFADQWLHLRNLDAFVPDARLYPDFDHNLRESFRRETELLFEQVHRKDQSILELIRSQSTYLNERLARHYGIPHIYGSHFRKVKLADSTPRGGILRHGSILTVTSYATRTSPVLRGKWILQNLLASPPPEPPPDIPALEDNSVDASLPVRKRLAAHREDPTCANCHNLIDPVGFGLENFDAVGRWRDLENGQAVDATGGLPDGTEFEGVLGLERSLLKRPELFVNAFVEKLMTYGLGRGMEYYDAPTIRRIVAKTKESDFRFSTIIMEIAKSRPFQTRMSSRQQTE